MLAVLLSLSLAASAAPPSEGSAPPTAEDAPAPRKGGFLANMRYGVGFSLQAGGGLDGTPFGDHVVVEFSAFELRSWFTDRFAWHTTLNVGRMLAAAIRDHDGRIDYGCHVAGHIPVAEGVEVVVAPGADLAYSFTGSRYQRFVGDARLGVDWTERSGLWTTGVYLRPYGGWHRPAGAVRGAPTAGLLLELVGVVRIPKKDRPNR